MFIHLIFLSAIFVSIVHGRHNVTVYSQNSVIMYAPSGSWSQSAPSNLDAGGSHMLTGNSTATAVFNFTGVAIYFMSPLWPYVVNTAVSLDSSAPYLIDLVDHSRPNAGVGPETVQSQVVWGQAGLANIQHTLVISVGTGQPYAIVDALIYTALDAGDLTTTVSSSTSTKTSVSSTTTTAIGAGARSSATSPSKHVLQIALGTVLGMLGLLIIALAVWFCYRRQRRPVSEAWSVAGHPYPGSSQMTGSVTSPRSTTRLADDSFYANNPAYYPPTDGWRIEPQYRNMNTSPRRLARIPVPMPPAGASLASQSRNTAMSYNNGSQGYNSWADAMLHASSPPPSQSSRHSSALVPQLNRLSTITEKSTPPLGGGTPLGNSPASQQTDIYYDAEENGSNRHTSRPTSITDNRSDPSMYPTQQPHLRRDPRDVALRSQQGSVSIGAGSGDNLAFRSRPPAYTADP